MNLANGHMCREVGDREKGVCTWFGEGGSVGSDVWTGGVGRSGV